MPTRTAPARLSPERSSELVAPDGPPSGDLVGAVFFEGDHTHLDAEGMQTLVTLLQATVLEPSRPIVLVGYYVGQNARSVGFAQRRLSAVRDASLASGVDPGRIQVRPLQPAGPSGERDGRRVEVRLGHYQ